SCPSAVAVSLSGGPATIAGPLCVSALGDAARLQAREDALRPAAAERGLPASLGAVSGSRASGRRGHPGAGGHAPVTHDRPLARIGVTPPPVRRDPDGALLRASARLSSPGCSASARGTGLFQTRP